MYTVTYILLMLMTISYSTTQYLGEHCLQKAVSFINFHNKCNFTKTTAKNFFQEDYYECKSKCSVGIEDYYGHALSERNNYKLSKLTLRIDGVSFKSSICELYGYPLWLSYLNINCSSWRHVLAGQECTNPNAYCDPIDSTCFCQCRPGYFMVNGDCLMASVTVGNPCKSDLQCTGTDFSGVCSNGSCKCRHGYLQIDETCHQDNVVVGGQCLHNKQCTGTANSGVCERDVCTCKMGYISVDQYCYKDNVVIGGPCFLNEQCTGIAMSGMCEKGECTCEMGYISVEQNCYEGNVSLDRPCTFHAQCSGHPYTSCINGTCSCLNGYVAENSSSCILHLPGSVKAEIIGNQQGSGLGTMLGALFGGVLLGVLITTGIVFVIYKRIQPNANKRQTVETRVVFADNNANGNARIERNVDNASRDITKQRKVVNVPPYTPSDESVEYSNVPKTSRRKLTNEDVYNHLNEKEERVDDDYYDHASAATGHVRDMSDYSSMRDMEKGSGSAKRTDNYFTLEQN